MQIKIYTFPIVTSADSMEEMNNFLKTIKLVEIKKELVVSEDKAFWTFCISYLPIGNNDLKSGRLREKVDYKEVLDEASFERFTILRKIRKQLADKDAVPAYAVFTDAELAEISKIPVPTSVELKKINGIGIKKLSNYGEDLCRNFLEIQKENEKDGTLMGENIGI